MKIILTTCLIIFSLITYGQRKQIDTTTSRTKLYTALSTTNSLFIKDEFDLKGKTRLNFTAVILQDLTKTLKFKGTILFAYSGIWANPNAVGTYFDELEIDDIIKCLKYIIDNVNMEQKPDHDIWIYYKTVDDFEIGAKALKNSKYKVYLKQNYRIVRDEEVTMNRKDLDEVYESFNNVRDFLKMH